MTRRPTKRRLKDYLVAGALSFLMVWLLYLNFTIARKEELARAAANNSAAELKTLQSRQVVLQKNINELSTERGQEATLRETFGVAKPGEGVIIIVPPKVATTTPPKTFWQQWFGWLPFVSQPTASST